MDSRKKRRLESAGWRVSGAAEFLGLNDEETAIVELKLGLADAVKEEAAFED